MREDSRKCRPNCGATNSLLLVILVALTALAALTFCLTRLGRNSNPDFAVGPDGEIPQRRLVVFCAAGMRYPMERIREKYEKRFGVAVEMQYAGSNTLLSQLEVHRMGDLYLAADNSYLELAREKGLAKEIIPLAHMKPVIAVAQGNPKNIQSIADLLKPGMRLALGSPEAAAVGKKTRKLLQQTGQWEALERQVTQNGVFKPTVNDVANDIKLQSVDAGIIWDATVEQYDELEAVSVPELDAGSASIGIAVLNSSKHPTAALRFARFVAARDAGLKEFKETGFQVVDGDVWAETPKMTVFAGSVNRHALESILKEFEAREGAQITTVYDGCGILTAQMRTMRRDQQSGFPDAYMACDVYYLNNVRDWFQEDVNVTDTPIVLVVQKGNPKGIQSLEDLTKPGVRVVVGQPEQCTIGVLSKRLLEEAGIYDRVLPNIVMQTTTSALLVPNITTLAADAVLAFEADTQAERDKLELIRIDSPAAKAIQPYSIARSSEFKHMARRLYAAISNSRSRFEAAGFHWRLATPPAENDAATIAP